MKYHLIRHFVASWAAKNQVGAFGTSAVPRVSLWWVLFVAAGLGVVFACTTLDSRPGPPISAVAQDPSEIYGELFRKVQLAPVFSDSKEFVDLRPRGSPAEIVAQFNKESPTTVQQLREFVGKYFLSPDQPSAGFQSRPEESIENHIRRLWTYLRREPDVTDQVAPSLLPLPFSYIVPGGRFREIYYWDSYFTQLGLLADGEERTFRNMILNFVHLLNETGRIPNGNRTYFLGRSQPPFFSHMVALWQDRFGTPSTLQFLPALEKEYHFWMRGEDKVSPGEAVDRVVRLQEGGVLNRYWDDRAEPRSEGYKEDVALAEQAAQKFHRLPGEVYRDLRAAAESGWDFGSRWFSDPREFATIQTTSLVPVDLNSLLYHLELKLAELFQAQGQLEKAAFYGERASVRRKLVREYLWHEISGSFRDFNWRTRKQSEVVTAATVAPLFVGLASPGQARRVAKVLDQVLVQPGGVATTRLFTGQQWDAPNGWPPLQWMAYAGVKRYGQEALAEKIRRRWLQLNLSVYQATGKLVEKYDVVNLKLRAGGGEYPLQDGYGWTNGVYRAMSTSVASLRHLESGSPPLQSGPSPSGDSERHAKALER
ncbi:MAG: hypothetical protein C5B49_11085 [Bdellovibrio sp.]|nr:MAG: hypothetical protein C5B49_11085 [Bdellovibrio sp.]